jgi:hypothetical protein
MASLTNIPPTYTTVDPTIQAFDAYYTQPLELDANTYAAITGFFAGRGFSQVSSESIAVTIMKQAKKDNINPMKILDSLKGLDSVEISALVSEILNYNRLKTSLLGYATTFVPNTEIQRNIVA